MRASEPKGESRPHAWRLKLAPVWEQIERELPKRWSRPDFEQHPLVRHWLCSTTVPQGIVDFKGLAARRSGHEADLLELRVDDEPLAHLPRDRSGQFSDKTASHMYNIATLVGALGNTLGSVLEIGAGFGNLQRLLLTAGLSHRATLVDCATLLGLQRWFLSRTLAPCDAKRIDYVDALDHSALRILSARRFDLGVAIFSLTETPWLSQDIYIDHLLSMCERVLIIGQCHFKGRPQRHRIVNRLLRHFDVYVDDYVFCEVGWPTFELLGVRRPGAPFANATRKRAKCILVPVHQSARTV